MSDVTTISQALRSATQKLEFSSSARLDAELLLANSLNVTRSDLYREPERILDRVLVKKFSALIRSRGSGMPIPYLTGKAEFWSLEFEINTSVLIPRPETELLVEFALGVIPTRSARYIAELGTGSGAIAAALALARPASFIVAIDHSLPAVRLARRNLVRLGAINAGPTVANWLSPFAVRAFDFIVANPPYLAEIERCDVDSGVHYEPDDALYAGYDGLNALAAIIARAPSYLTQGGWLALEHGYAQGSKVRRLLKERGFKAASTIRDLNDRERVSFGHLR